MSKKRKSKDPTKFEITQSRLLELQQELKERILLRDTIAKEIKEATELGDLKENDPYKQAMERKEINETRIDELEHMIDFAEVVEEKSANGIINIGSKVELENEVTKKVITFTLVGAQKTKEANPLQGKISMDSPLGEAVYHKTLGNIVDVKAPNGVIKYKILKVS